MVEIEAKSLFGNMTSPIRQQNIGSVARIEKNQIFSKLPFPLPTQAKLCKRSNIVKTKIFIFQDVLLRLLLLIIDKYAKDGIEEDV